MTSVAILDIQRIGTTITLFRTRGLQALVGLPQYRSFHSYNQVCLLFDEHKATTDTPIVVKHLTSFNRSPTWVVPDFAEQFAPEGRDTQFSEEQKAKWRNNPESLLKYRKEVDSVMNHFFDLQYKDSSLQHNSVEATRKAMAKRLKKKPQLAKVLVLGFALGCRR